MVKASKYVEGVESIYVEQPEYEEGHNGSDGKCDCIGMCRGGLIRAGQTKITNMRGTNQAARKTIRDLQELKSEAALLVGDVVLKTRDKDDPNMRLPDNYRKGGKDYDERWGETNFTHIGTVTSKNPLVITHMTSPRPKKDKSIKDWGYFGELPYVEYEPAPEPQPEPEPDPPFDPQTAIVESEDGNPVKMRAEPDGNCRLWWKIPIGTVVIVDNWSVKKDKKGNEWAAITWGSQEGYMINKFLRRTDYTDQTTYCVIIPGMTREQAEKLKSQWPGAMIEEGVG